MRKTRDKREKKEVLKCRQIHSWREKRKREYFESLYCHIHLIREWYWV